MTTTRGLTPGSCRGHGPHSPPQAKIAAAMDVGTEPCCAAQLLEPLAATAFAAPATSIPITEKKAGAGFGLIVTASAAPPTGAGGRSAGRRRVHETAGVDFYRELSSAQLRNARLVPRTWPTHTPQAKIAAAMDVGTEPCCAAQLLELWRPRLSQRPPHLFQQLRKRRARVSA